MVSRFNGYGTAECGGFLVVPPNVSYKIHANNTTLQGWFETIIN